MMPAPQQGGGEQSAAIRQKLMQLLAQAAKIAEQNGIDFGQLVMEFSQGGQSMPPPPPSTALG